SFCLCALCVSVVRSRLPSPPRPRSGRLNASARRQLPSEPSAPPARDHAVRPLMSRLTRIGRLQGLICPLVLLLGLPGGSDLRAADPFADRVVPLLKTYCVRCHNQKVKRGELDLTRFSCAASLAEGFREWEHVVTFLKKEEMPPAQAKQP